MVRFGHIVWLLIVKIPKKSTPFGVLFFCAIWNGARDNVSLDSFRGDFCAPFGIKGHQCLSLGALSKGGFLVGLLCGFWNKMSAVAAQCLLSGCFSRGCAFFAAFDKISKPAKSNSAELCRLFHLLQYCDSGGVIFAGLFRPFVLPHCHTAWGSHGYSFFLFPSSKYMWAHWGCCGNAHPFSLGALHSPFLFTCKKKKRPAIGAPEI